MKSMLLLVYLNALIMKDSSFFFIPKQPYAEAFNGNKSQTLSDTGGKNLTLSILFLCVCVNNWPQLVALFGEVWAVRLPGELWHCWQGWSRKPRLLPVCSLLGGYGLGVSPWLPDPAPMPAVNRRATPPRQTPPAGTINPNKIHSIALERFIRATEKGTKTITHIGQKIKVYHYILGCWETRQHSTFLYLKIKFKDEFCSRKPLYKYKVITMGIQSPSVGTQKYIAITPFQSRLTQFSVLAATTFPPPCSCVGEKATYMGPHSRV